MSTKDFLILNSQNDSKIGADKIAMRCPQNVAVARPKLADISNLPQKPRLLIQHEKSQSIPVTTKEYIEQLQKENMALAKMVAQRNKIIEQSGIELDRLRLNMIKMQEQNRQLALSHTLTLTELNSGKDRLKALQHELGCKIGLLKARELQNQEDKASTRPRQNENVELQEERESSKDGRDDEKPRNTKRRLRSQSLGASEPSQSEDNAVKRRTISRRQSGRFKAVESKDADNLFGINNTGFQECPLPHNNEPIPEKASPITCQHEDAVISSELQEEVELSKDSRDDEKRCNNNTKRRLRSHSLGSSEPLQSEDNPGNKRPVVRRKSSRFKAAELKDEAGFPKCTPVLENESISVNAATVEDEEERSSCDTVCESQRPSICRPSRVAAKKVQSYKEIPLNTKMRRSQ
ncbi:hypothetical protein ACP275_06G168700 [Erythranthe tilingii]